MKTHQMILAFTLFGVMMGTDAGFQKSVEVITRTVVVTFGRFADNLTDTSVPVNPELMEFLTRLMISL